MLAANPTSRPFTLSFEGAPVSKSVTASDLCVLRVSVFSSPNLYPFNFKLLALSVIEGSTFEPSNLHTTPPLSPFTATLASPLQSTENLATLSPAFATLTRHVNHNPFVCHSYKKHPGWGPVAQTSVCALASFAERACATHSDPCNSNPLIDLLHDSLDTPGYPSHTVIPSAARNLLFLLLLLLCAASAYSAPLHPEERRARYPFLSSPAVGCQLWTVSLTPFVPSPEYS